MQNRQTALRLAEMTSAEFQQLVAHDPVILLPLGSQEDHGPLLPMGDFLLADALAGRAAMAAAAAGVAVCIAPCLPFGAADFFGDGAGGLAISPAAFRAVLGDLLDGLLRHGLRRIVILNGHGGNAPGIHEVTLAIRRRENVVIPSFYLWKLAKTIMSQSLGPEGKGRFGHGAEPLLSLAAALRPELRTPAAEIGTEAGTMLGLRVSGFGTLDFGGYEIDAPAQFGQVPRAAIQAAAPFASAELGSKVADELIGLAAAFIVHVARV